MVTQRCSARNDNNPHNDNDNRGFRVVLSTFFPRVTLSPPEMLGGFRFPAEVCEHLMFAEKWRTIFLSAPFAARQITTGPGPRFVPGLVPPFPWEIGHNSRLMR
jgi:hypothetical protein